MAKLNKGHSAAYLKHGRLADVLAALQVMGAGERPEHTIVVWAHELSRKEDASTVARWANAFEEHPEFFMTYRLEDNKDKAALRLRYTNKLYDAQTGKTYTKEEKDKLPIEARNKLTTKPLDGSTLAALMTTAIELHSHALDEQNAKKWWIPIITAFVGFLGAIIGAYLGALGKGASHS